ncbi:MAG: hypothetical protein QG567_188 [Campylobacterota bacterium]|nr:hypothetical protein [Campylobacterota bacterium]
MNNFELLHNTGISFLGDIENASKQEQKTFIILGVARGGTSLIAGALAHLGIFSGDLSVEPVYEDRKLAEAFESGNDALAKQIIDEYNKKHPVWAFKRPQSMEYIEKLHAMVENPIYLVVFKDIFSIANRNKISMKLDIIKGMRIAFNGYEKIFKFLETTEINGALFSYEKIMASKEDFVDSLVKLADLKDFSDSKKSAVYDFITPNPQKYLDMSRITKSKGTIGNVAKTRVVGWAASVHGNQVVDVELYINGQKVAKTKANQFRPHLLEKKMHPTGHCGYEFTLTIPLKHGDQVRVRACEDVVDLNNSPYIFKLQEEHK